MDSVEFLAHHPYMKVTRVIEDNIQKHREEEHIMKLSTNGIETTCDTFSLDEVLDISYRDISQQLGHLYLHTTKGLYAYVVRVNPHLFILKFRKIKAI
ncbi:hypothetical protein CJ195_04350 [Bacillus sp. UMB0899]|uniref:hypothetical protein n=1 Tax=Metabacillus schmidteae TaxID=2730405 RepID=UPI000C80473C|nr:hypothetical protein [Metabacillus schmidteae]PMC39174.1 hypothetical protein CJ195_04350 [Bacillus sp. UMB0899]